MKKFLKVSALALLGVLTVVFFGAFEGGSQTVRSPTDAVLFPHDRVIDVYIEVDEAELQDDLLEVLGEPVGEPEAVRLVRGQRQQLAALHDGREELGRRRRGWRAGLVRRPSHGARG